MKDNIIDKNLDGIRKIKPAEFKKSRELVLSSIGEDFNEAVKKKEISPINAEKKMDSLSPVLKPEANKPETDKARKEKLKFGQEQIDEVKTLIEHKPEAPKKMVPIDSVLFNDKKTKTEEKDEVITEQADSKIPKAKPITKRKKLPKNQKKTKIKKVKPVAKKKIKKKNTKNGFIISYGAVKRFVILWRASLAQAWHRTVRAFKVFLSATLRAIRKGLLFSLLTLLAFVFLYLLLASVVLNFGKNSSLLTTLSIKIPIPAVISSEGIIYFEKYKTIFNNAKVDSDNRLLFDEELARVFILDRLFEKHQVSSTEDLEAELVFDEDVNIAPLNRIRKIKNTIQSEDNFIKIAKKFGDVYQANINNENADKFSFSDSIRSIQIGETSDIIVTRDGYYIVHCFERVNDSLTLSYLYIPAVSLDEYLTENAKNYKFWNLTNF